MNKLPLAIGAFGSTGLALLAGLTLLDLLISGQIELHSRLGSHDIVAFSERPLFFALIVLLAVAVFCVAASLATLCLKVMLSSD